MLPPKGHNLIRFLTQVVLPKGRLEYSKVINTLYMFSIGVLYEFFCHRERDHLDTLNGWQSEDMGFGLKV